MNKELQEALLGFVKKIEQGLDFAVDQAPLVIKELLMYHTVLYSVLIFLALVTSIILFWIHKKYKKKHNEFKLENKDKDIVGDLYSEDFNLSSIRNSALICAVALVFLSFIPALRLIKVIFMPRVWLMEYAMNLT